MKKIRKALNYSSILLFALLAITACDTEYSSIESNVLGENNFNFNTSEFEFPIVTYNRNLKAQQINGLTANLLGYFNDPIYGETTASIVSQVTPTSFNPDFGTETKIDSVILTIPYFSTQTSTDTDGKPIYQLDSLYVVNNDPANTHPINLTVYENKYFLRDFNPNSTENSDQNYFSLADGSINSTDNFAQTESGTINFDEHVGYKFYEDELTPSAAPREIYSITETDTTKTYSTPAIEINLAKTEDSQAYWKSLILDQSGQPTLSNSNNFHNYFRGLYIKAQAKDGTGSMVLLNLANSEANVVVYYSYADEDNAGERIDDTYTLTFTGNKVNTFVNNYNPALLPTTPNTTEGDETLYLKGTEGSMAVIELFNGLVDCDNDGEVDDDAFDCFKKFFRKTDENGNVIDPVNDQYALKRLINEAHLVIYEDESFISPNDPKDPNGNDYHAYDRLFLYNLENNYPLLDYDFDITTNASDPLYSRAFSLGLRTTDDDGVSSYKLKITDYLNSILIQDVENTKLGLVLSNNVNQTLSTELLNSEDEVTGVPATAIITPRGTVLHGSNSSDLGKKIRLEIFYTEYN